MLTNYRRQDRGSPSHPPRKRGFSTSGWQTQGAYNGEQGQTANGRVKAQDWFEDRQQHNIPTKPHLGTAKDKPAWNVWVAPNVNTPERRFSNPQPPTSHNSHASGDSPTSNGPQIHPDRLRLWSEEEQPQYRDEPHEQSSMARNIGDASTSDGGPQSSEGSSRLSYRLPFQPSKH